VFLFVSDPVGMGLVESMGRPGGNITGFAAFEPSLAGKWLELLKEIAPGMTRTCIVYNPHTAPNAPAFVGPAQSAGSALGVSVVLTSVRDNAEIDRAIAECARQRGGGLILVPDPFTAARPELMAAAATRHGLPLISPFRAISAVGGLASYGIDGFEQISQVASYVNRILRGEKPADLPVQQPTKFELVINLKTAKTLGLTIPTTLLARADWVIE
jgi:putative ABC transport system substrate-binding protein